MLSFLNVNLEALAVTLSTFGGVAAGGFMAVGVCVTEFARPLIAFCAWD